MSVSPGPRQRAVISELQELNDDRPLRVLVTAPLMRRRGGVAQYMQVLRPHLCNGVQYFTVGKRSDDEGIDRTVVRMAQDIVLFRNMLKHGECDLVHLNPSFSPRALIRDGMLLTIARIYRKAVVVTVHGWNESFERTVSAYMSWLFRLVYGRASAFIVLSEVFKEKLRSLGYTRNVFVQGPAIEDQLLHDCRRQPVRRPLDSRKKTFNILFLARVERTKGIYETLEAYRLLKREHPFVSLTVAGEGSELSGAIRYVRAERLTDVSFTGHVEHAAKYQVFQSANAYLLPSHTEGLPLSVLEAMASGLPIVTCAVGGLRDWFQDGAMGFIAHSRDPDMLASLLSRIIRDPLLYTTISLFNREYTRDHFTGAQVAARIEGIYRILRDKPDQALLQAR